MSTFSFKETVVQEENFFLFFSPIAVSVRNCDQMCVHDNVESAGIVNGFVRFLHLRIDCKHIYIYTDE